MTLFDEHMKHIPEYYDTMYLDGFTPAEIYHAFKKKIAKDLADRRRNDPTEEEITITTEVRTKK